MIQRNILAGMVLSALCACGTVETRFDAAPLVASEEKVSVRFARIEVVAVSLPVYAQSEDIHVRDASGAIVPLGALWADDPARGVTLNVATGLAKVTDRLVAPEPWPFRDLPDVRVDIRLDAFLATNTGTFRIAGQVFVAPEDGTGRDRARAFEIETPVADPGDATAIAQARAVAERALVSFVATEGLR